MCHILLTCGAVSERSGHFFYSAVAVPRLAVPFTLQQQNLLYPLCSTVSNAITFRSAHIFHRCSSYRTYLQQNLKILVRFFHMNCIIPWDSRKFISIVE